MAVRIYADRDMAYRVVGGSSTLPALLGSPDASQTMLKAVEEFAVECSIVKVFGSEMLDYVVG